MAVNKNFVVRNGLEVNTSLILADANTNKVGIGSTVPRFELDVVGGIGATDVYVSGVATFISDIKVGTDGSVLSVVGAARSVGVGTAIPAYLLDVRSATSTGTTALYVQGDVRITGDLSVDDINFDQADINSLNVVGIATIGSLGVIGLTTSRNLIVSGVSTFNDYVDINDDVNISGTLSVGGATTIGGYLDVNAAADFLSNVNISGVSTFNDYVDINSSVDISSNLNVSGIGTIGTVKISSGIITATTGSITYYGDGSKLTNILSGVGISSLGTLIGIGATILNFVGTAISTVTVSSGIATIKLDAGAGGGGGGTPGGSDGQVQYNSAGTFAGSSNLRFNGTSLSVGGATTIGGYLDVNDSLDISGVLNVSGSGISTISYLSVTGLTTTSNLFVSGISTIGGYLDINSNTDISGTLNVSGIVTAADFNSTSDASLKENVFTVKNALNTIERLRGVSFDWKENHKPSYGVIAQELEKVLPALVSDAEIKTVNYNGIIGVLIEAIKELKSELDNLKSINRSN